ncbi:hypothetical protein CE91St45_01840 [Oscillospiraceae bacterium]|nr:hypothetical protein CE91St45_01840 [Oscillospiraceae bacterium]
MAENNTSNIGFEKQIWDAACVLRGNIDASEYKSVVLGLIFLKYISDRFEAKYKELVEEGDGFEEDQDEYTAENIFFVPENARWSAIAAAAHTPEIGTVIDDAMRSIEKENKRLKDILPKNFARPELDKRRLGEVVDLFTNIQMIEHGNSKDILGRTYEYCLSKFAEQEGRPSHILCKPPRWCIIEAPQWRFYYGKRETHTGRKCPQGKDQRAVADGEHRQHGRHPEPVQRDDCRVHGKRP